MTADDQIQTNTGPPPSLVKRVVDLLRGAIENPVIWFRETVVEPNRPEYYWYHEQLPRVPTVDECYEDDIVCQIEADDQFVRDRRVDTNIIEILKRRLARCKREHVREEFRCDHLKENLDKALTNYFIKYGDLSFAAKSVECLMKQKHRMAWERRHGKVGTGRKSDERIPQDA